jgi:hypothetical protein
MNPSLNELPPALSLDGEWEFSLNNQSGSIHTPGTWEAQGYARRVDGPAHFRRQIHVPAEWRGRRVELQFDAVSYHIEAFVNDRPVGTHAGMWTPFAFDVTEYSHPGEINEIRLVVYKPGEQFPMRESLAGFLPDVCLPFGGIWQSARLTAFAGPAISDLRILANRETGRVHVQAALHYADGLTAIVRLINPDGLEAAQWQAPTDTQHIDHIFTLDSLQSWHPEKPYLYTTEITLQSGNTVQARVHRRFGFRTLSTHGDQLLFNDVPICLRGVLNWGWYPEILCPAPDEATIRAEFRRVRELGYNMVKLCLYVPSPLYFQIADEEGMFLWLELPMWLPKVTPRLREQAPLEYAEILAQVHHHPSIVIYSLGCELGHSVDAELLSQLDGILRSKISGALACDNSGSGEAYGGLTHDYADFNDYHFYCDLHYFTPLVDHFRRDWRAPRPWIFGEFCDADDYRDLEEIMAAYGGDLPWWLVERNPLHAIASIGYPEQRARMAALDTGFDFQALQRISRQQSFVVRKAILEKVRGRAGMGGYIVTSIRDTPLATSSLFDDLGRMKYAADAFREFNADSVLVLEQGRARVWKHGGDCPAPVDRFNLIAGMLADYRVVLSHSGQELPGGELRWMLLNEKGVVVEQGIYPVNSPLAGGAPREIGTIAFSIPDVEQAAQYTLEVELNDTIRNHWPLWIYPAQTDWPAGFTLYDPAGVLGGLDEVPASVANVAQVGSEILLSGVFTPEVEQFVQRGGRAIVLQTGPGALPTVPCPFWREAIKLLHSHPILNQFPHQGFADLQFYHLATDYAFDSTMLTEFGAVTPIFRRLDARQFMLADYLVEVRIGSGILLASTLRFAGGAGDQVSGLKANAAGRFLLNRMMWYLASQPD